MGLQGADLCKFIEFIGWNEIEHILLPKLQPSIRILFLWGLGKDNKAEELLEKK